MLSIPDFIQLRISNLENYPLDKFFPQVKRPYLKREILRQAQDKLWGNRAL